MKILIILLLLTGCAAFDEPRLNVPFIILDANADVNSYDHIDDVLGWGTEDYWATPKEFYRKGAGDCEDYAIAKYFALRQAGIPANRMRLVVGELDDGDSTHMVLFVKYKETFVLDNVVQKVTPLTEYLDFKVLYKFNETGVYFNSLSGKVSTAYIPKWQNVLNKMKHARER